MAAAFPAEDWQQSDPSGQGSEEAPPAAAGTARQVVPSASEEECGWIWICAGCLWSRCCSSRGGSSSLAGAGVHNLLWLDVCFCIDGPVLSKLIIPFYRSIPSRINWLLPVSLLCCLRRDAEVSTAVWCLRAHSVLTWKCSSEKVVAHHDWEGFFVHLLLFR